MNLRLLLSLLLVYRSNFHLIHWLAKGKHFDRVHALANEYYDMLLEDADAIAEMCMRLKIRPVNYLEASKELENCKDQKFLLVASDEDYDLEDLISKTDIMLNDILSCIEVILESAELKERCNVGIKSDLEAMHSKYDLEARYKNVRRTK